MLTRKRSQGFTLVEILIVVVILGILAAIVIPQFSTASDAARASSTVSQLQTIRSQLELYKTQHQNTYPDIITDWSPLLETSSADPTAAESGSTTPSSTHPFGPYLQKAPTNPFMGSDTVAATAADGVGWEYSQTTGVIRLVLPASANPTALGLDTTDYVQLAASP